MQNLVNNDRYENENETTVTARFIGTDDAASDEG